MDKLQVYNLFKKKKNLERGLLLAVEGVDGSGKNTQVTNVENYLLSLGYKVKVYRFPQYDTPIGNVIATYLRGDFGDINNIPYELISIAYAADRVAMKNEIQNLLNAGYIILLDRYTYSNVFNIAKMNDESKWIERVSWIEDIEFNQMGVVKPNLNIYLHVDPKISIQRIKERGKREYQQGKDDVYESNHKILIDAAKLYYELATTKNNWLLIDQMKNDEQISMDETFELLKKYLDNMLQKIKCK